MNDKKREQILEYAFDLFASRGYSGVTMDDIAHGIGMGKGTLYKYFGSKEELLLSDIDHYAGNVSAQLNAITENPGLSAVDKLGRFMMILTERLSVFKPAMLGDVLRGSPAAVKKIKGYQQQIITGSLTGIIEEGRQAGIFRPEIDSTITTHIILGAIHHIMNEQSLLSLGYGPQQIFRSVLNTILAGCLTEEGRKLVLKTQA